jgi:hypothetical protein
VTQKVERGGIQPFYVFFVVTDEAKGESRDKVDLDTLASWSCSERKQY